MASVALPPLDLPPLRRNPFDLRPLEHGDFALLVGRDRLVEAWGRHVRSGSPRQLLLAGERGSGRTSLIRVLTAIAGPSIVLDLLPHGLDPVDAVLGELAAAFDLFDQPRASSALVGRIVQRIDGEAEAAGGQLPLVALDLGGSVGPDPGEVLVRLQPVLRRLRALTIVVATPGEVTAWPEGLEDEMDERVDLAGLDEVAVDQLVVTRLSTALRESWHPPEGLVRHVVAETGGHVGRVMRLLRDLVDHDRGALESTRLLLRLQLRMEAEGEVLPTPARVLDPLHEVQREAPREATWQTPQPPRARWGTHPAEARAAPERPPHAPPMDHEPFRSTSEGPSEPLAVVHTDGDDVTDVADEPVHGEHETHIWDDGGVGEDSREDGDDGVELFADGELLPPQSEPPLARPQAAPPRPPISGGAFGGLQRRHRVAEEASSSEMQPDVSQGRPLPPDAPGPVLNAPGLAPRSADRASEWWSDEASVSPPRRRATPQPPAPAEPGPPVVDPVAVAARLAEAPGEAAEAPAPLNAERLRSLGSNELEVLRVAAIGELSPSDPELLERLGVGRARLSQVSNGLRRDGILTVRKDGRRRLYRLSDAARDQLLAWGGGRHG